MRQLPKREKIKTESPIEDILLREFNLLEFYPIPQFKVNSYRIDLAFPEHLIAIECDGKEWHSSGEQLERDREKDDYLEKNGWTVVRISGSEIYRKADEIAGMIVGQKKERLNKFQKSLKLRINIDYKNESLDLIEDKKEKLQFYQKECEEEQETREFIPLGDVLKKRYKYRV